MADVDARSRGSQPPLFGPHDLAAVFGLVCAWLFIHHWLPRLPSRVPAHWNAAGRIDGWMNRGDLFRPPIFLAGGAWLLLFVAGQLLPRRDDARGVGRRALGAFRGWLACGLALMAGYVGPMAALHGPRAIAVGLIPLVVCLAAGGVPLARAVREAPPIPGATESDYRMGGLLYWNAGDDRLLVRKRIGIGWTLNFAQPLAWVVLALMLLPAVLALALGASLGR